MNLSPTELNAQIDQIEASIVERELRLRARVDALAQRVDEALPKVAAAGAVAGALGLVLLWMRSRKHAAKASAAPSSTSPADGSTASSGWLHWVQLAWPLLPLSLRAAIDLRLVLAIGKPLVALFKRRHVSRSPSVPSVPPVPPATHPRPT